MEPNNEKRKRLAKWIIAIATACILIYLGVQNIGVIADAVSWVVGLIMPLLLGFAFALIFNVPMSFIESHLWKKSQNRVLQKLRRPISLLLSIVLIIGVLAGVFWLIIPELIEAVKIIIDSISEFVSKLAAMDKAELAEIPFGNVLVNTDWDKIGSSMQNWLQDQGGNIMNTAVGTISTVVGGVFDLFISLAFSVYILANKEKLKKQACRLIRAWIPEKFGEWLIHAANVSSKIFRNFVSGQTLEAIILGALCTIGMLILRIPYAPTIGALVGVAAMIPVVGAVIGAIIGAFMILTVSPIKAVIFLIFLIILQQLEGNFIYPKVMGNRVNLPAMWILAAVTIGGGIAGPVGMLLGVPVVSTIYVLLREATEKRERNLRK